MGEKLKGHNCPVCNVERWYKTKQGQKRSFNRKCRACANSFSMGGTGVTYDTDCQKLCGDCKAKPQKYNSLCYDCNVSRRKQYYRDKLRFEKYGISKEEFLKMYNGKCEICGVAVGIYDCNIDHCHESKKVRGILCNLCNKGLGQFKDKVENLEAAIKYLKEKG